MTVANIETTLLNTFNKKYCYLSYNVTMTCNGADRDKPYLYKVHARGYGESHQTLHKYEVRLMKGRLIAVNSRNTTYQTFFYKAIHAPIVGKLDSFSHPLHNSIMVTSAGIIKTKSTIVEACEGTDCRGKDTSIPKITRVLIALHSDWHLLVSFFLPFLLSMHHQQFTNPLQTTTAKQVRQVSEYQC